MVHQLSHNEFAASGQRHVKHQRYGFDQGSHGHPAKPLHAQAGPAGYIQVRRYTSPSEIIVLPDGGCAVLHDDDHAQPDVAPGRC